MSTPKGLPSRQVDFSAWYNEVITQTEMVDQSPTRGCVVLRPYGYAIWEEIKAELDRKIKEKGIQNAYFPLFIPESFLKKEAQHVEGFSPELAVVTHAGGKKLEEAYVVRPTSETIVYHMFSRWISSWRDLPLKINQWANIVRWELRTRPFLRTTEILWQEGHTAHINREEADSFAREMLALYVDVIQNFLAIPLFIGRKTPKERFAGADETYCMEAIMPDGKALQMGTSHLLAHSFPAAYGVQFQDKDGQMRSPWCTSWGMTTRLVGATVMVHGDDQGLILPPKVAPHQVVIVPIYRTDEERNIVLSAVEKYASMFKAAGVRVHVDLSDDRPGSKFFKWEMRGVPLRVEIGPRDVANECCMIAKRIVADSDQIKKESVSKANVLDYVKQALEDMQKLLFKRACVYRESYVREGKTRDEFGVVIEENNGFVRVGWCGDAACESVLSEHKTEIRCVLDEVVDGGSCCICKKQAQHMVIVAKSY